VLDTVGALILASGLLIGTKRAHSLASLSTPGERAYLRLRHRSELLHQSEGIEDLVLLDDLAVA
jgi:hypothetical protein